MLLSVAVPELGGVLLILLVVVFGGSQLPKIAKNVGSAGKEFRKAQREAEEEEEAHKRADAAPAAVTAGPVPVAPVAAPAPAPVAVPAPVAATAPDDDRITISKADLAALLDERLGRGETSGHSN